MAKKHKIKVTFIIRIDLLPQENDLFSWRVISLFINLNDF